MIQYLAYAVKKVCENKAQAEFRSGGELNGWIRNSQGLKAARVTIPKGRDPLKMGTLNSIIRQLKLDRTTFATFMDCSMRREEYLALLDTNSKKKK